MRRYGIAQRTFEREMIKKRQYTSISEIICSSLRQLRFKTNEAHNLTDWRMRCRCLSKKRRRMNERTNKMSTLKSLACIIAWIWWTKLGEPRERDARAKKNERSDALIKQQSTRVEKFSKQMEIFVSDTTKKYGVKWHLFNLSHNLFAFSPFLLLFICRSLLSFFFLF